MEGEGGLVVGDVLGFFVHSHEGSHRTMKGYYRRHIEELTLHNHL